MTRKKLIFFILILSLLNTFSIIINSERKKTYTFKYCIEKPNDQSIYVQEHNMTRHIGHPVTVKTNNNNDLLIQHTGSKLNTITITNVYDAIINPDEINNNKEYTITAIKNPHTVTEIFNNKAKNKIDWQNLKQIDVSANINNNNLTFYFSLIIKKVKNANGQLFFVDTDNNLFVIDAHNS